MITQYIKHYVIVRFFPIDLGLGSIITEPDFIRKSLNIFRTSCLQSLLNQTNKNFEIILLINDNAPIDVISEFVENTKTQYHINISPVRYVNITEYLYNNVDKNEYDWLITTRMDYDDLIYNEAANNIQEIVKSTKYDLLCHGYCKGCTIINKDYNLVYEYYNEYNNVGAINIFQSLAIRTKYIDKDNNTLFNINQVSHVDFAARLNIAPIKNNCIIQDKSDMTFCYMKTDQNLSSIQCNTNKWHRSDNKINKPKEWYIERFGNFLIK